MAQKRGGGTQKLDFGMIDAPFGMALPHASEGEIMIYSGTFTNGVVVLENGVKLPDGSKVRVELMETAPPVKPLDSIYRIAELAGPTGIPDLSINIDHYLYGHPKVSDERP